jgi:hypothetical protein
MRKFLSLWSRRGIEVAKWPARIAQGTRRWSEPDGSAGWNHEEIFAEHFGLFFSNLIGKRKTNRHGCHWSVTANTSGCDRFD